MEPEQLYTLMQQRRSIRQYQDKPVPRHVLESILHAALWAPSGKNLQNWRFFVVQGDKKQAYLQYSQQSWLAVKDTLEKRLKPSLYQFTERFFYTFGNAPVLIFAYSQPHPEENNQTMLGSVYMAVQNLILAAQAEGLSTCALGSPLEVQPGVDEFLGLTGTQLQLVCGVTLGYADHSPPAAPRQLEGRITWVD